MNTIASEPARLQAEQHRIKKELASAAVEHHPVLVDASERAGRVAVVAGNAVQLAEQCERSLSKLKSEAASLQEIGATWRKERASASCAVGASSKIVELLDAPATLDACVRGEMYHEARLLIEHIGTLAESMPDVPLMVAVANEVHQALLNLVTTVVLPRLGGNLSVAVALKITGFLRHIGIEEETLRDAFLRMRSDFVNAFVAEEESVDASMPATLLKRILVHWKVVIPDVIATYNGCFSNTPSNGHALAQWCLVRTRQMLDVWDRYLPFVSTGAELADLSAEISHCAPSWSAFGVDLSPRLLSDVAERITAIFVGHLASGRDAFEVAMANAAWKHTPSMSKLDRTNAPSSSAALPSDDSAPTPPPRLVQCLPLTYIAHSVVTACNDIRKCAAAPAWHNCNDALKTLISGVLDQVLSVKDDCAPGDEAGDAAEAIVAITAQDCIPFICRCVDYVFDTQYLSHAVLPLAVQRLAKAPGSKPE